MADIALDEDPYQHHAGSHRVQDCIKRDRSDYAAYLDLLRTAKEGYIA
ncbi:hypothetical protein [Bifidobacterium miconis]|nr:hypothetical protein [Bifidobacterium miconis]